MQELVEGAGPAAAPGDSVLVDYVLRRANGYFIYGSVEGVSFQPRDVPVGPVALRLVRGSSSRLAEQRRAGPRSAAGTDTPEARRTPEPSRCRRRSTPAARRATARRCLGWRTPWWACAAAPSAASWSRPAPDTPRSRGWRRR